MINQEKSGKYIAEKRKQLGMTQKDLAEHIGLTDKAVSKWERGKSIPDSAVLLALALTAVGMYGIFLFPGRRFASFIDVPSFVLLIGINLFVMIFSGCIGDFIKAFRLFSKKNTFTDRQIERSFYAVKLMMVLNIAAGAFLTVGQAVLILNGLEDGILILKMTGIILLPFWYGMLLDLIFMPLVSKLYRLMNCL